MQFKRYISKQEFIYENLSILIREEKKNDLFIGILAQDDKNSDDWLFGRVENEKGNVEMIVMLNTPKNGLLIYSPTQNNSVKIAKLVVKNIIYYGYELTEIYGENSISEVMAKEYEKSSGRPIKRSSENNILYLDKLEENENLELKDGFKVRLATSKDIEKVKENVYVVYEELLKEECNEEIAQEKAEVYIEKGLYILTNYNKELFAQVLIARDLMTGYAFGAAVTSKKYKGNNYSQILMYNAIKNIQKEGIKFFIIHVASSNEERNKLYEEIGFKFVEKKTRYYF
jgi:predicted GNAT family N-acyltransferase